jgi:quinol-cytochrome oxidoreductase complex cytochrome b subunit
MASSDPAPTRRTVGAFDVRFFIAIALGLIGVFLLIVALFADPELDKTGGIHANLWTGVALVVAAAVFTVWARLRPMYVDASAPAEAPPQTVGAPEPELYARDDDTPDGRAGPGR